MLTTVLMLTIMSIRKLTIMITIIRMQANTITRIRIRTATAIVMEVVFGGALLNLPFPWP